MSTTEPIACCAPLGANTLSDEEADATAALFRAIADPARVRIVNLLATSDDPVCICNLVEPLALTQPTVSHHMKKLVDAGLVVSGTYLGGHLVEIVELAEHPWFLASQFHPEFKSRPTRPAPLFREFVGAALARSRARTGAVAPAVAP